MGGGVRLNLYWRGRDVIDVELHVWRRRADDEPGDECPKLTAAPGLQGVSRAAPMEPDTAVFGFGLRSDR